MRLVMNEFEAVEQINNKSLNSQKDSLDWDESNVKLKDEKLI